MPAQTRIIHYYVCLGAAGGKEWKVNMTLPRGSFISLVGEPGCGKSTIAGILAGKNKGYRGDITIGGVHLNNINEKDLMNHVVLVRHNSYLKAKLKIIYVWQVLMLPSRN